jgi:N6-adenosine-specific RNA methylase IME4
MNHLANYDAYVEALHAQAAARVPLGNVTFNDYRSACAEAGVLPRGPDGKIDNCALAYGDTEADCQMCNAEHPCPDRARFVKTPKRTMLYSSHVATLNQVQAAGGYRVIYADPAWSYDQKVRVTLDEAKYRTMTPAEVQALPVGRLAAKDCALFLWGTWPQLPVVLATIAAWGFEYKTLAFVWVKRNEKAGSLFWGAGSWTRANTEPCFLAVRGKPKRADAGVHQLIEDFVPEDVLDAVRPDNVHSAKPAAARDRIRKLMGDVPSIELFARERVPEFGNCWGDDPRLGGSDVILEAP